MFRNNKYRIGVADLGKISNSVFSGLLPQGGYYDAPMVSIISMTSGNELRFTQLQTSAGIYLKKFYLYTNADKTVNYLYVELPNYNDYNDIWILSNRGWSFEVTNVTSTWANEIAGKTLLSST